MPLTRSLAEILDAHGQTLRDDVRVSLPAVVTAVHADRQTVDVQISIKNPLYDSAGNISYEKMPSIADVPIGVLRGNGFFIWLPIAVNDSVMLVFSDLSTDNWRASDGIEPVAPGWAGKHTADSPIAIPCLGVDSHFLVDPALAAGKIIIGKDGSPAQIRISATEIDLGTTPTSPIALATPVNTAITALQVEVAAIATWIAAIAVAANTIPLFPGFAAAVAAPSTTLATAINTTGTNAVNAAQLLVPSTVAKSE